MKEIRNKIEQAISEQLLLQKELEIDDSLCKSILKEIKTGELIVAVVGEVNRGKSTFLNALMGTEVFPSRATVCTAGVTILDNGDEPRAEIVYQDGRKEKIELSIENPGATLANYISRTNDDVKNINALNIKYPNNFSGNGILLVDTPGVNDPDSWREEITYNYLGSADAVIMLLDPMKPLSASEVEFLRDKILDQSIKKLIFIVNKIDHVDIADRQKILDRIKTGLEEYIPNPEIHMVSSKKALSSKLNNSEDEYISSGFKHFEDYLLKFLMKGRGGALLETKIQKCESINNVINENIDNRIGALNLEKGEVGKRLMKAEKELVELEKEKNELKGKIDKEQKPITSKLNKSIDESIDYFNSVFKSEITNEPHLPQLRTKVLGYQKETVKNFGESVKRVNEELMDKYQTESMGVMTKVKQLLSGLNKQVTSQASSLEVSKERQAENRIIEDNSTINTAGTTAGALGGAAVGSYLASTATWISGGYLMAFTSLGVATMGLLSGGLGLLAGAGIASLLKNKNQKNIHPTYVEAQDIVNNQKAADSVRNFLKGMKNQGGAIAALIVKSFGNEVSNSIDNTIKNQNTLITNIKKDINSTKEEQDESRKSLNNFMDKLKSIRDQFSVIHSDINRI